MAGASSDRRTMPVRSRAEFYNIQMQRKEGLVTVWCQSVPQRQSKSKVKPQNSSAVSVNSD